MSALEETRMVKEHFYLSSKVEDWTKQNTQCLLVQH